MSNPVFEVPSGAINGSNRIFTATKEYVKNSTAVYLNGILLLKDSDSGWVETSSAAGTITFNIAPEIDDDIQIFYLAVDPAVPSFASGSHFYLKGEITRDRSLNGKVSY